MKKAVLALLAFSLILSSCVHKSPFETEYYFQALGEDNELVVTADAVKLKESYPSFSSDAVIGRADRISLSLTSEEEGMVGLSDYSLSGALEGNYGTILVNTAISMLDGFEKEKEGNLKYYTNGEFSLYVPKTGILLFTDSDYASFYDRTIENRKIMIPFETASNLASSMFSIFIRNPRTMLSLGFDIPLATLMEVDTLIASIDEKDGLFTLDATFLMKSERSANTLTNLLRTMLVTNIRKSGGVLDFDLLSKMLYKEGSAVIVFGMNIERATVDSITENAMNMIGGVM